MSYRPESERKGFTHVLFRDGSSITLRRNEFEPLCEALRRGDEWFEATGLHGSPEFLRLSTVQKVGEATPEGIAAFDAEEAERLAYKKTHGDDE